MTTPVKEISIQKRLHRRVLLVSLLLVAVFLFYAYHDVRHETEELFDAQLARSARLILSLAQAEIKEGVHDIEVFQQFLESNRLQAVDHAYEEGREITGNGHYYETKLAFAVASRQNEVLLHSYNAPPQLARVSVSGYSTQYFNGYDWRLFRLDNHDGSLFCVTAERLDVRNDLIYKISSDLLALFASLLLILTAVIWFAIGSGLAPLKQLADQIQRRNVDNLHAVNIDNVPTEVRAIVRALNRLFQRLSDALTRERHITSDAAHELRTPLAAVKLHAELALSARENEEKNRSLQYVLESVNRSSHLVDQLLKLARLEPQAIEQQHRPVDLVTLAQQLLHEHQTQAEARQIELHAELPAACIIPGDEDSLRLMLRNLLDNAIRYTQQGGRVLVRLEQTGSRTCLIVQDNGPGISEANRQRIFERFYRVENHENTGCGIGMAIVARVCELHNARIELTAPDQDSGLVVTVCFPPAGTAAGRQG